VQAGARAGYREVMTGERKKMKKVIASLLLMVSPVLALASGGVHLDHAKVDVTDVASVQRGAKYFVNYCLSCHSAKVMRYNRLGADYGLTEEQLLENLIFTGVKVGSTMNVAMSAEDAEQFFGKAPPDLSVIARSRGADWLYTYLTTFYKDDTRPFGVNNIALPGASMPHVLVGLQGLLKVKDSAAEHGPKSSADLEMGEPGSMSAKEYEAMVTDLVNYLVYMGEPAQLKRAALGPWVLGFLLIFTVLAFLLKKEYWKDVH